MLGVTGPAGPVSFWLALRPVPVCSSNKKGLCGSS